MNAPSGPGIDPRWTSSSKDGVGTAVSDLSRIWFTLSHGILNEIYYPRIDTANTRDVQFLVADGNSFFSEEKRDTLHSIEAEQDGIPAYRIINREKDGKYTIEKIVICDPVTDVVLQKVTFSPESKDGMKLFLLAAPHIMNGGKGNTAWIEEYKGRRMAFASKNQVTMAIDCDAGFGRMSCGFSGINDGWQDISRNKDMTMLYDRAENGNVAITCEIPPGTDSFTIAIGFGSNMYEAAQKVSRSLNRGFEKSHSEYIKGWKSYINKHSSWTAWPGKLSRLSLSVLKTHEAKAQFRGAIIASLSIPWGRYKGDDELGGYHLIWPRDMVEAAGALIAAGDYRSAIESLDYLAVTQEKEGNWPQNMWLDGNGYWKGIQMDETAFPVILAGKLRSLGKIKSERYMDMVGRAAEYIAKYGPITPQDRWEEDSGYSPFTIAAEISALLIAAEFFQDCGNSEKAEFLRSIADIYESNIEFWNYAGNTDLARSVGVEGYYVRISPPDVKVNFAESPIKGYVPVKNRPYSDSYVPAERLISTGSLSLVRFGIRRPDDERIRNTIKVIDSMLKTETKNGPVWHRYNGDGYGEHSNGDPFDGTGHGRGWPLLAGERGHYEIALGNTEEALKLLQTIERQTSSGGLIPEQIWDDQDIPEKGLYNGKPSGSAMPLVWAHAEYIKLAASISSGKIFDMPEETYSRYIENRNSFRFSMWSFFNRQKTIPRGYGLRIMVLAPATIRLTVDDWASFRDIDVKDSGLGVYYIDIDASAIGDRSSRIIFTFYWKQVDKWEGKNYEIGIV